MSASEIERTFLCYVLGQGTLPRVADLFDAAYGASPDAVDLFTGPSGGWDGASLGHVVFRQVRTPVANLPEPVRRAAAGRPEPGFVLEAASTVPQAPEVAAFIRENLLRALADRSGGIVADADRGLLYTGEPAAGRRDLPWNHLEGGPDPGADDWSDVI